MSTVVLLMFVVSLACTGSAAVFGNSCENGGNPCTSNGVCVGLFATPFCLCQSGYADAICNTSLGIDPCPGCTLPQMGNACDASPCRNGATCINWFGGFKCLCGENSSGRLCESAELCFLCESNQFSYNECPIDLSNKTIGNALRVENRHSRAWCVPVTRWGLNETGNYIYVDEGCRATFCINFTLDYCAQEPCDVVNYRCENDLEGGTYRCIPLNPCYSTPCQNNGTCVPDGAGFTCNCTEFYTGTLCEVEINPCDSNPCQNGGTCTRPTPITLLCLCPYNVTGEFCETDISIVLNFQNFKEDSPLVEVVFLDSILEGNYFSVSTSLTSGTGSATIFLGNSSWIDATIEIFVYHDNDDNQNYNNADHGYRQVIVFSQERQEINISYSDLQQLVVCPFAVSDTSGFALGSTGINALNHFFCYAFTGNSNFSTTGVSTLPLGVVFLGMAKVDSGIVSTFQPASTISKYLVPGTYSFVCAFRTEQNYDDPFVTTIDESLLHKFNVPAFDIGNSTSAGNARNCDSAFVIQNENNPFPTGEVLPRFVIQSPLDI